MRNLCKPIDFPKTAATRNPRMRFTSPDTTLFARMDFHLNKTLTQRKSFLLALAATGLAGLTAGWRGKESQEVQRPRTADGKEGPALRPLRRPSGTVSRGDLA